MMSLLNKSADWPPNYHKILIFFPTTSLKCLHAARIDELADSNDSAISPHGSKNVLKYRNVLVSNNLELSSFKSSR